jgi:hypothetical protein
MTTAYFQNPRAPDRIYEILSYDKERHRVLLRDAGTEIPPFEQDALLLKLLEWKLLTEEQYHAIVGAKSKGKAAVQGTRVR